MISCNLYQSTLVRNTSAVQEEYFYFSTSPVQCGSIYSIRREMKVLNVLLMTGLVRVQTLHTSYFIFLLSVRAQVKLPDIASKSKRVHGLYITFTSLIFLNLLDSVGSYPSLCHVFVHVYQSPNTDILNNFVIAT